MNFKINLAGTVPTNIYIYIYIYIYYRYIYCFSKRERERERENRGVVHHEPELVAEHVGASEVKCQKSTLFKVNFESVNTTKNVLVGTVNCTH